MTRIAHVGLLSALIAAPLSAQIPTTEYAARRDTVAAHMGDGVLLSFGAGESMTDEADFHQLPAFQYLTGYDRANAVFVMAVHGGKVTYQMLFEPPIDPRRALYDGFAPDSADLAHRTGLGLRDRDQLRDVMDGLAWRGTLWTVTDAHSRDYRSSDSLSAERYFTQRFWAAHPGVTIRSADAMLDSLMVVKSPAEIALLRKAVSISVLGEIAAMKAVHPGVNEGQIQALTDYTFRMAGASGPSFRAIIGSGLNSTSYHYRANDRDMQAGEMVVMDMGALYDGYAGDVTRTIPVNGKYTADQAAIYAIVRSAQQAAADVARPGAPVGDGDKAIRAIMATELARLGPDRGAGCLLRPAVGRRRALRAGAGGLLAGLPLHGARSGARHRPRGARRRRVLLLTDRHLPAERGLHHRAGRVHQHRAPRHAARHAEEPRLHREGAADGGAVQSHRDPDRGRLPDHADRRGVAVAGAEGNEGDRGGDAGRREESQEVTFVIARRPRRG